MTQPSGDSGESWGDVRSTQVPTFDEVAALVRDETGFRGALTEATALQSDIGVYGDDMDDLLSAYSERFGVDMAGYVWYFHTGEEGWNFGGLFFPPPYTRVPEIPITVAMLHRFAVLRRWAVAYPPHAPPRARPDIWVNWGCIVVFLVLAALAVIK